jgi:hypothetical protein
VIVDKVRQDAHRAIRERHRAGFKAELRCWVAQHPHLDSGEFVREPSRPERTRVVLVLPCADVIVAKPMDEYDVEFAIRSSFGNLA